jgi:hypothetical protein
MAALAIARRIGEALRNPHTTGIAVGQTNDAAPAAQKPAANATPAKRLLTDTIAGKGNA